MNRRRAAAWLVAALVAGALLLALLRTGVLSGGGGLPGGPDSGSGIGSGRVAATADPAGPAAGAGAADSGSAPADGCNPDDSGPLENLDADRIEAMIAEAQRVLAASGDAEHLLAAAVLPTAPGSGTVADFGALAEARTRAPGHPLLPIAWLSLCERQPDRPACAGDDDERHALREGSHNGVVWALVAGRRMQRGDSEAAFEALTRAVAAPEFDSQLTDFMLLFERALAASTGLGYAERVAIALGAVVTILPVETRVVTSCREDANRPRYGQPCLAYAERLERDGRSVLEQLIGMELQAALLESAGSDSLAAEARARAEATKSSFLGDLSGAMERWMWRDEQVLAGWLDRMQASGELAARRYVRAEYERRVEQGLVVPCTDDAGARARPP